MFGHRKGAFTGADRDKPGLLEMANGGTFFLDELTEMPLPLQAKLLRVMQDGVVRRVGSEQQDAVVDVRFISATNRDPREAIEQRRLREDLFYRLNVVPITLPPLRERVEDIPILANHFLAQFWERHRSSRDALPQLQRSRRWSSCGRAVAGQRARAAERDRARRRARGAGQPSRARATFPCTRTTVDVRSTTTRMPHAAHATRLSPREGPGRRATSRRSTSRGSSRAPAATCRGPRGWRASIARRCIGSMERHGFRRDDTSRHDGMTSTFLGQSDAEDASTG